MEVSKALSGVLTLLGIILCGFVMSKKKLLDLTAEERITKIITGISVPCIMYMNARSYISPAFIKEMGLWLLLPFIFMLLAIGFGAASVKAFGISRGNRGVFATALSQSNVVFVGIPLVTTIYGDSSSPFIISYYISNAMIFWTLGVMMLEADGGGKPSLNVKTVRNLFSPSLLALFLGVIFNFYNISFPVFINEAIKMLGSSVTPFAMLIIGAIISRMGAGALKLGKEGAVVLLFRYLLLPAAMFAACRLLGAGRLMTYVFTISVSLPVMNNVMLIARQHKANYELAAQLIAVTSVISLIFIPLLVFVMPFL